MLDLPRGDPVSGGRRARVVRAEGIGEARRKAIGEAEDDIANVLGRPMVERLLWSVDGIDEELPTKSEAVSQFFFYADSLERLPEPLAGLVEALVENDLWLQSAEDAISVHPEADDHHGVSIRAEGQELIVSTDEWHGHYDDPEQAVACFRWLLTPFYRTVVESQAGEPSATWVESWEADGWRPLDETIFRNPTDPTLWMGGGWRREYRQQAILRPPEPYGETVPGARLDAVGMPLGAHLGLRIETFPRPFAEERGWLRADYDFDPG